MAAAAPRPRSWTATHSLLPVTVLAAPAAPRPGSCVCRGSRLRRLFQNGAPLDRRGVGRARSALGAFYGGGCWCAVAGCWAARQQGGQSRWRQGPCGHPDPWNGGHLAVRRAHFIRCSPPACLLACSAFAAGTRALLSGLQCAACRSATIVPNRPPRPMPRRFCGPRRHLVSVTVCAPPSLDMRQPPGHLLPSFGPHPTIMKGRIRQFTGRLMLALLEEGLTPGPGLRVKVAVA